MADSWALGIEAGADGGHFTFPFIFLRSKVRVKWRSARTVGGNSDYVIFGGKDGFGSYVTPSDVHFKFNSVNQVVIPHNLADYTIPADFEIYYDQNTVFLYVNGNFQGSEVVGAGGSLVVSNTSSSGGRGAYNLFYLDIFEDEVPVRRYRNIVDGSQTVFHDIENGQDATLTNYSSTPVWTLFDDGRSPRKLIMDGVDDWVNISGGLITFPTAGSFAIRWKAEIQPRTNGHLIDNEAGGGDRLIIKSDGTDGKQLRVQIGGSQHTFTPLLFDGLLVDFTLTFDYTNAELRLSIVDGVSETISVPSLPGTTLRTWRHLTASNQVSLMNLVEMSYFVNGGLVYDWSNNDGFGDEAILEEHVAGNFGELNNFGTNVSDIWEVFTDSTGGGGNPTPPLFIFDGSAIVNALAQATKLKIGDSIGNSVGLVDVNGAALKSVSTAGSVTAVANGFGDWTYTANASDLFIFSGSVVATAVAQGNASKIVGKTAVANGLVDAISFISKSASVSGQTTSTTTSDGSFVKAGVSYGNTVAHTDASGIKTKISYNIGESSGSVSVTGAADKTAFANGISEAIATSAGFFFSVGNGLQIVVFNGQVIAQGSSDAIMSKVGISTGSEQASAQASGSVNKFGNSAGNVLANANTNVTALKITESLGAVEARIDANGYVNKLVLVDGNDTAYASADAQFFAITGVFNFPYNVISGDLDPTSVVSGSVIYTSKMRTAQITPTDIIEGSLQETFTITTQSNPNK